MCKISDLGTKEFPEGWTEEVIWLSDTKLPVVLLSQQDLEEVLEEAQRRVGGLTSLGEVVVEWAGGPTVAPVSHTSPIPPWPRAEGAEDMICDFGGPCLDRTGQVVAFCMT